MSYLAQVSHIHAGDVSRCGGGQLLPQLAALRLAQPQRGQ